jgi:RES domain-containing protein
LIAYRRTRSKYAQDLSGSGGWQASGRCHRKGTPVIYPAEHVSLALLEVLVHLDISQLPLDYTLVTIAIPDNLPSRQTTPEEALAASGDPDVPAYLVPSVIVPHELNVVLFPRAVGFRAAINQLEPFRIDERLIGLKPL